MSASAGILFGNSPAFRPREVSSRYEGRRKNTYANHTLPSAVFYIAYAIMVSSRFSSNSLQPLGCLLVVDPLLFLKPICTMARSRRKRSARFRKPVSIFRPP